MPYGFIQDKFEIKLLILYILARVAEPVDLPTLTDLTMCDGGVDYFSFTEELAHLKETEHVTLENELYAITDKGRQNGEVCEEEIPISVRMKCDKNIAALNAKIHRRNQVKAEITSAPRSEERTVKLTLSDDSGPVFSLSLLAPSQAQAEKIAANFKAAPEDIWNSILMRLVQDAPAPKKAAPEKEADRKTEGTDHAADA